MGLACRKLVNMMTSILFVCTGNIFRSMTAEYALRARLSAQSSIRVSSAGIQARPQEMHPDIRTFLKRWVAHGPTHHFALGVGHRAETLRRTADALGIESVIVSGEN